MGTNWSEDEKGSSQQQAVVLPVHHSDSENVTSPKARTNRAPSPMANNNHHRRNDPKDARKELLKLPHNCQAIVKDSDSPIDTSSQQMVYKQLHAGVFLNGRRKKYWVDKKGNNCFMIFANGMKVIWAENQSYWHLHTTQTSDHGQITVAQLRNVCWLEVEGRLHTTNLTPGVTYQVAFIIMLEYTCYGWDVPVNFRLTLPNGSKQEHKENFKDKPKGEWLRIPVGEFKVSPENKAGEVEFSLYEVEGGNWKKGLVVKSAVVEPKY